MTTHTEWLAKNRPAGLGEWHGDAEPTIDETWRPAFGQLVIDGKPQGPRLPCRLRLEFKPHQNGAIHQDRALHFPVNRVDGIVTGGSAVNLIP